MLPFLARVNSERGDLNAGNFFGACKLKKNSFFFPDRRNAHVPLPDGGGSATVCIIVSCAALLLFLPPRATGPALRGVEAAGHRGEQGEV